MGYVLPMFLINRKMYLFYKRDKDVRPEIINSSYKRKIAAYVLQSIIPLWNIAISCILWIFIWVHEEEK